MSVLSDSTKLYNKSRTTVRRSGMDNQYQVIPSSARVRTAGLPEATAGKRYPKNRDYFFRKEFELSLIQTAMDELGITRRGIAS